MGRHICSFRTVTYLGLELWWIDWPLAQWSGFAAHRQGGVWRIQLGSHGLTCAYRHLEPLSIFVDYMDWGKRVCAHVSSGIYRWWSWATTQNTTPLPCKAHLIAKHVVLNMSCIWKCSWCIWWSVVLYNPAVLILPASGFLIISRHLSLDGSTFMILFFFLSEPLEHCFVDAHEHMRF